MTPKSITLAIAAASPSIDEQVNELNAAGWTHVRGHVWKAPVGGYFMGPNGAWKAMKRREAVDGGHFQITSNPALCEDCPPLGYPTDSTRCWQCPNRSKPTIMRGK